jgi:peptidyl-prolyl cis-trans isomerase B (cyclophilin B)
LPAVPRHRAVLIASLALVAAGCGSSSPEKGTATETATPKPKATSTPSQPYTDLDPAKTYVAKVTTSLGTFQITLDAKRAPKTGGSFKHLADTKFFDGLTFHRIVPGFVIQGGDPKGDGSGGPDYSVVEPPPGDLVYKKGVVAMAKTQTEAPGTSGSQFFVVIGSQAAQLPAEYALLGTVTKGMAAVDRIGKVKADPSTGAPASKVTIKSIRVTAS